jgi:hypothetical protein
MRSGRLPLGTLLVGLALLVSRPDHASTAEGCRVLEDGFEAGLLSPDRWLFTSAGTRGPFRQEVVGQRLRVGTAALGTDDGSFEHVGVVHPHPLAMGLLDLALQVEVPSGGEGAGSAAVYLAPVLTWSSPEDEPDWLKFAYESARGSAGPRAVLAVRRAGQVQLVAAEGDSHAATRPRRAGPQALRLELAASTVRIFENGALWHESRARARPVRAPDR